MKPIITLLLLITISGYVSSYQILALLPIQIRSHFAVFEPLLKALSARGHNVTVFSNFPSTVKVSGYNDISINSSNYELTNMINMQTELRTKFLGPLQLGPFSESMCEVSLSSNAAKIILESDFTYDIVISEFFNTNCMYALLDKIEAPLIGLSSSAIIPWFNGYFGNPMHPAYIPNVFMHAHSSMNFWERVENTLLELWTSAYYKFKLSVIGERVAKEKFGDRATNLERYLRNASLLLVNTHHSLHGARPLVPNIIEVGGMHIRKKEKLPLDIEEWLNGAKDGVIYFNMGSMIRGQTLPEEKRRIFTKVFRQLPQRVLWKWENGTLPGKSDNVMIKSWMPQLEILSHVNVKAFISHGGLLGTTEAVHCGVPMIIMPQYGDQGMNGKAVEKAGAGLVLPLNDVTEESLKNALKTIITEKFNKQAKDISNKFRDRPQPPLETAVYWVEHVGRHKGAPHMRSQAADMPWYQYLLIDVITFLFAIVLGVITILYFLMRAIFHATVTKVKKE